jgi:hypothetical protein
MSRLKRAGGVTIMTQKDGHGIHSDIAMEFAVDYLHVTPSEQNGTVLPVHAVDEIVVAAAKTRCHGVLVDARNHAPQPSTMDCFEFADLVERKRPWPFFVMALVVRKDIVQSARFTEVVAGNRGVFLRVFDNDLEAANWIRSMTGDYRAPYGREAS